MRGAIAIAAVGLMWMLAPGLARADVRVTALDGRGWTDVVSDLTQQLGTEGSVTSICVRDENDVCEPCGAYALSFDPDVAGAFEIGACDPATGATDVRLIDRTALFDHAHEIPVPRAIAIHATRRSSTTTQSAMPRASGSEIGCSVSLHPYVRDLEHGARVFLDADRYEVRVAGGGATIAPNEEGGFIVSSTEQFAQELSYDVVERATGAVVLVGRVTLACTSTTDVPATEIGTVGPVAARPHVDAPSFLAHPRHIRSGIHAAPNHTGQDVTRVLEFAGGGIAAVSALTLIGIGVATAAQIQAPCTRYGASSSTPTATGVPPALQCVAWGAPTQATTPEELTWATLGTLGAGAMLALSAWIADLVTPSHDEDAPHLLVALGPTGGDVGLSFGF